MLIQLALDGFEHQSDYYKFDALVATDAYRIYAVRCVAQAFPVMHDPSTLPNADHDGPTYPPISGLQHWYSTSLLYHSDTLPGCPLWTY